jgi:hypothetical protein
MQYSFRTVRPAAHDSSLCCALNRKAASLENACGVANFGSNSDTEQDASNYEARQLENSCGAVRPVALRELFVLRTQPQRLSKVPAT